MKDKTSDLMGAIMGSLIMCVCEVENLNIY